MIGSAYYTVSDGLRALAEGRHDDLSFADAGADEIEYLKSLLCDALFHDEEGCGCSCCCGGWSRSSAEEAVYVDRLHLASPSSPNNRRPLMASDLSKAYVIVRYDRHHLFWTAWAADEPLEAPGPLFERVIQQVWMVTDKKKKAAIRRVKEIAEAAIGERDWVVTAAAAYSSEPLAEAGAA